MLYRKTLAYILEIVKTELISKHYDNLLIRHFRINKTQKLITQKYYQPTLRADIGSYNKGSNICLTLKIVKYKPYSNL